MLAKTQQERDEVRDQFGKWRQTHYEQNSELSKLRKERERMKEDYQHACGTIAAMHKAAVGITTGPSRGVVEDVEDVRLKSERLQALLADARDLLKGCTDNGNPFRDNQKWQAQWDRVLSGPAIPAAPPADLLARWQVAKEKP